MARSSASRCPSNANPGSRSTEAVRLSLTAERIIAQASQAPPIVASSASRTPEPRESQATVDPRIRPLLALSTLLAMERFLSLRRKEIICFFAYSPPTPARSSPGNRQGSQLTLNRQAAILEKFFGPRRCCINWRYLENRWGRNRRGSGMVARL